jgi:hypothetical protein
MSTRSNPRHSKIYPNWDFWFESGNPASQPKQTLGAHGFARVRQQFGKLCFFRPQKSFQRLDSIKKVKLQVTGKGNSLPRFYTYVMSIYVHMYIITNVYYIRSEFEMILNF